MERSHGVGRPWQSSRDQEVSGKNGGPGARDASVEQLLCQSSLEEGEAEASEVANVARRS